MIRLKGFMLLLAVSSLTVQAQYASRSFNSDVSKVGTTAVPFLTIGVGARANAMGGAYVSVANDVTALFWNPAGIASLQSVQLTLIHSNWIADLNHDFVGFAAPIGIIGCIGFSLNALTMDETIVRTPEQPNGTGERVQSYDMAIGLSYARMMTDRISIGGTAKYIRSQLWHMSAQTMAFDLGIVFSNIFNFVQLGAAITNMGGKMRYSGRDNFVYHDISPSEAGNNDKIDAELKTDSYNIPISFRVGLSTVILKGGKMPLRLAMDLFEPSDNVKSLNVGGEWTLFNRICLRAGYAGIFEEDTERGLTFGGGLQLEMPRSVVQLYLDYSYEDFGLLNNSQKFSLLIAF
ncbi:PorV/PorQ family protein [candidate division KSB1 bacterium]|nr:PorV/PorQ family protein [candidate division KSB1 bacterium]